MTVESFLERLSGVRKTAAGWQAQCPAHEDRKASLSISVTADRILIYCHAGCKTAAILEKMGLKPKDLFLSPLPKTTRPDRPEIVATYDYTDETGKLLFQTVRFRPKDFRQRHPNGKGGWIWSLRGVKMVPYRLPEVLQAPAVFVVEGEKDVETLMLYNLAGTCNPMGAGKWREEWGKYFTGKEVTIIPDNDEPGRKHAEDVAGKIFLHAKKTKILTLPSDGAVKDVSDWFTHGGTIDQWQALTHKAREWKPKDPEQEKPRLKVISADELQDKVFPEPKWAVPGLLTEGLTILAGRPKRGKSWMGLGLALAVASGGIALGKIKVEKGDALYLALEDNERRLQNRLDRIKGQDDRLPSKLHLVTDFLPLAMGGMTSLLEWLDRHKDTRLVIIDTLGRILPSAKGNNNQFADDYRFVGKLQKLAIDRGFALLIIHHIRKESAEYALDRVAGTTGITGAADSVWVLDTGKGEANAILHVTGRDIEAQEIAMQFDSGIWSVLGDAKEITLSGERKAVVQLLTSSGPLYPKAIADALGKSQESTRKLLFTMKKAGEVSNLPDGMYTPPLGNGGNGGNAGNGGNGGNGPLPLPGNRLDR